LSFALASFFSSTEEFSDEYFIYLCMPMQREIELKNFVSFRDKKTQIQAAVI